MPESTNLNVSPYFDDYDANSQYYKVLFQPAVSVQVRELNYLQSMLQNQVEQFGDNILTQGTIVSGCTFQFFPEYPYVKIRDNDLFGAPVVTGNLVGFFAQSTNSGLSAIITNYADGFESQIPDLKTTFVSYLSGGNDGNTHVFSPGETLLITDANVAVWTVNVLSSGVAFSNSDFPVFTPALIVNVTTGAFTTGDYITQPSTSANLQVANVDTTTLALEGQAIIYLSPRAVDLANSLVNTSIWSVANNDSISNLGNTAVGSVISVAGSGAAGTILTDGSGRILQVPIASGGAGYIYLPTVSVRSINNPTGLAAVNLKAQNFLTKVIVANTADAVGNGYAFGVSDGVIYQKGYFLRVEPQVVVIDKYDSTPNNISIGFLSSEAIITPNQDESLLDNALGTQNFQAPGANRLQIVPRLVSADPVNHSQDFFPLVAWSEGNPFLQRQDTAYGVLQSELARRTFEAAGDFSIDQFNIKTRSPANSAFEGNTFSVAVDPGTAYVQGYRVATQRNFVISDRKGIDTNTAANVSISLNYDDWLPVSNVGGVFQFSTGDSVRLYDTAKGFTSNATLVAAGNVQPVGTQIGSARIRSFRLLSGTPGDPTAQYSLYLFDLAMNQGQTFANVHSIFYNGSIANGICDVVLTQNPQSGVNICQFSNTLYDTLIFPCGQQSLQSVNNVTYLYRTIDQGLHFANTGILTKTLSGSEYWPYANSTALTTQAMANQYCIPIGNSLQASVNAHGTVTVNLSSNVMVGSSTTFLADFVPGDWIYVFSNSTVHDVRRVYAIANNTRLQMDDVSTIDQSACSIYRYFPKYVPIPFGTRTGLTANVDSSGQLLTLNLGLALTGSVSVNAALGTDIQRLNVTPGAKSAARDQWVVLKISNNAAGTTGPWCMGIADVSRLKSVTRTTTAPPYTDLSSGWDVTGSFYIDQRQNQDFVDLSYLCQKQSAGLNLTTSDYLIIKFDAFQVSSQGYYVTQSYVGSSAVQVQTTDSLQLANLGSNVTSWEVPLAQNGKGDFYNLLNCYDFRPICVNTATSTANLQVATVNPTTTLSFGNTADPTNDLKFPSPDCVLKADQTYYLGRQDAVFISTDTNIFVATGHLDGKVPNQPSNTMALGIIDIPPYPCLPQYLSNTMAEIITLRTLNENRRLRTRTISPVGFEPIRIPQNQPKGYNMAAIGSLEDRIRNLEYYQSLSALQTDLVNRVIPSGVAPTLNRFKYGLFVDNFSNTVSQAFDDPNYAASITTGVETPPVVSWAVRHGTGALISEPYIDFPIVTQPIASGNTPNTAVVNAQPGWVLRVDADTIGTGLAELPQLRDNEQIVFANATGVATLYFYVPLTSAVFLNDPDQFFIYQGNTLILNAGANAVALTANDVTYLHSNSVPGGWFSGIPLTAAGLTKSGSFVSGSGKMSWTHNPAGGTGYTIVSVRETVYDHWRWALSYPALGPTIPLPALISGGSGLLYQGVFLAEPTTFLLALNFNLIPGTGATNTAIAATQTLQQTITGLNKISPLAASGYYGQQPRPYYTPKNTTLQSQGFGLQAFGLKAGTKHTFKVGGVDQSAYVRPAGGNLGDPLITDVNGTITFDYFYSGGATQQGITSQLLSNTAPIAVSQEWWILGSNYQPIGDGSLLFELSAPNSLAQYVMQVAASPEIPLNLLKHK